VNFFLQFAQLLSICFNLD